MYINRLRFLLWMTAAVVAAVVLIYRAAPDVDGIVSSSDSRRLSSATSAKSDSDSRIDRSVVEADATVNWPQAANSIYSGPAASDPPVTSSPTTHTENVVAQVEFALEVLEGPYSEKDHREALRRLEALMRDTSLPQLLRQRVLDALSYVAARENRRLAERAALLLDALSAGAEESFLEAAAASLVNDQAAAEPLPTDSEPGSPEPADPLLIDEWIGQLSYATRADDRRLALDRLSLLDSASAMAAYEIALRDPDAELRIAAVRKLSARSDWQDDGHAQLLMQEAQYDSDPRVGNLARWQLEDTSVQTAESPAPNPQ